MSQHNSSMISSGIPNSSEAKYQKALKQISKLINTNKILKNQCQQRQQILGAQLSQIAMRYEDMSKKYQQSEQQKRQMQQFMEQLQDTNQDLRKQYQTMQRQVGYLNDVLTQQNGELKKLSAFKDQKGISQLFRSYQQQQAIYKKDNARLQQYVSNLKATIDRLQSDLAQQTQMRQRYQDQYNIVGLQINKYRDLNNYLMNQNQSILNGTRDKQNEYNKNQQLQAFVYDFRRQLETLRNVKYQAEDVSQKQYVKNYELLLQQKNSLAIELAKTKDQLEISQTQIKQMYEVEEKMSTACAKSDILIQQNNMLKNRITILQSKQIIDGAGFDEDSQLKDFQDKINFMMAKSDPLQTIKNGEDNTHFLTMKSFINDLQLKLQKMIEQRQFVQRKYKNLKLKFSKKAQENLILEDQNKLMKGKLQGYQRITQKLHYQLERSMHAHEDQIVKMVAITNNLVGRKVQESKTTSTFIKNQFDIQIQKAERVQKTLGQELQSLKLQNGTQRIKIFDLEQKLKQSQQFIQIYQTKLTQISNRYKQLEQQNTELNENIIKYEQLYRQQKTRHETILIQKQNLSNKINLLSEQISERSYKWQQEIKQKEETFESEGKRFKAQVQRYRDEIDLIKGQNRRLSTQLDQRKIKQSSSLVNLRNQNHYYNQLERNYNDLKQTHHQLQKQFISLKHKLTNFDQINKQVIALQAQIMKKSDQLNDQKRNYITLKKQLQNISLSNNQLQQQNEQLNKQIISLSNKIYQESSNITNKHSFSSGQEIQYRKKIQKLNQEITLLQSAVRDQKRNASRMHSQLQGYKQQIQSLQNTLSKSKSRQQSLLDTIQQIREEFNRTQDQLYESKSKCTNNSQTLQALNQNLQQANQKINQLNEQINQNKSRLSKSQVKYENLFRDLTGAKYHLKQAEKMVKRLNSTEKLDWEQQRQKQNLSSLVNSLNNIIKSNQHNVQSSNGSSNQQYSFVPTSSFGNFQGNYNSQNSAQNYAAINFAGSFGKEDQKNAGTNDSFAGYRGSSNIDSIANVNYSSDQFDTAYTRGTSTNQYRYSQQVQ